MTNNDMSENALKQVADSLDPVTKFKILKGAVIALSGAIGVLVLILAFGMGIDKATLAAFVSWSLPVAVNAYHQYKKGA